MKQIGEKILLIGFGDINQRLSKLLIGDNVDLVAVRRSACSYPQIDCRRADATDQSQLEHLLQTGPEKIVITLSPSDYSEHGYRNCYLQTCQNLVRASHALSIKPEVVFISSSSVYGQNNGEWVDEQTECLPDKYNGRVLLESERCLLDSELPSTVIRFAGIYGPGRYRLIKTSLMDTQTENWHWTNRIHADDCARVIKHVLDMPRQDRQHLYLASDCLPTPKHLVQQWIRAQIVDTVEQTEKSSIQQSDLRQTGKRCDNQRLLDSGLTFRYPSYKEGFKDIIEAYRAQTD